MSVRVRTEFIADNAYITILEIIINFQTTSINVMTNADSAEPLFRIFIENYISL